jgi:branched-chain amino acid transport system ATP-binding protein
LTVRGLQAGYGKIEILHEVSLTVNKAEVVAMLGPNGAGKSTLMRAISGLLPWSAGEVEFDGQSFRALSPRDIARAGMAHVIQGHRVFSQLSITDNLMLAGYDCPGNERRDRIEEALEYFPEIAAKRNDRAGTLSGGQQQMMVVALGLVKRPRLLILDEPSAGLSPVLVDRVLEVAGKLRDVGTSVLLVEQLVKKALQLADRVYALAQGRIVLEASTRESNLPARLERAYFGKTPRTSMAE